MDIERSNLFGGFDDRDLKAFLQEHPELIDALPQEVREASAALSSLDSRIASEASLNVDAGLLMPTKIDPDLPEIVLIHGITDCHLADVTGIKRRIWLNNIELVLGRFTRCLTLQSDGISDQSHVRLETDGLVWKKYQTAFAAWRQSGFQPHDFCYDWRRSVLVSADKLNQFLKQLATVRSGRKVVLVCHSMGGLVASVYAQRHPDWSSIVEHCVFVGSPLGGAYSVAAAILGKSESFRKLDRYSITEVLQDFQVMGASFPGMLDLLPNPVLFPEAEDLYAAEGWPGAVKPAQAWLDQSRTVKQLVWSSPVFSKATHLASQSLPTLAGLPWNNNRSDRVANLYSNEGDGSVLSRSSLVPGLAAYKVSGEHSMLCTEPEVIRAVEAIARGKTIELPPIELKDLTGETYLDDTGPASLVSPVSISSSPERISEQFSESLLSRFASDASRGAMLGLVAETGVQGFEIDALTSSDFSWQNALSLAMASEAAYQKVAPELSRRVREDWKFQDCFVFDVASTQGFMAWNDRVVVLSFRGTEQNLGDWLGNLSVVSHDTVEYGPVHSGFYDAFQIVRSRIDSQLASAMKDKSALWITGHSLGGALAVIAGAEFQSKYPIAGIYTYGQPKLGTERLADYYSAHLAKRYIRFVNNNDVVPQVPPGYTHFGPLVRFDENGNLVTPLPTSNPMALSATVDTSQPPEMSETEFYEMQARLKEVNNSVVSSGLAIPRTESQLDALAFFNFGFSIRDHSIRDAYIPILLRHVRQ